MEYYERIKNLRIDADKTQQEVANLLKTGQSYYAKYENGHRPLSIDRRQDLCLYYNVSADFILEAYRKERPTDTAKLERVGYVVRLRKKPEMAGRVTEENPLEDIVTTL